MSLGGWFVSIGGAIVGFLLGIVASILLNDTPTFDASLKLADFLNGIIAIGVAFFIGHVLRERSDAKKAERERLIARAEEVIAQATEVRRLQEGMPRKISERLREKPGAQVEEYKSFLLGEVLSATRNLANGVNRLKEKFKTYGVQSDLSGQIGRVEVALSNYREVIGETDLIPNSPTEADAERKYGRLANELDALVRDINRLR